MFALNTRVRPQKSLFMKVFWPCTCCNLHVVEIAGDAGARLFVDAHIELRQEFSGRDEPQVASLQPWETGRLYAAPDCFESRRRRWPSGSVAEFHLCSSDTFLLIEFQLAVNTYSYSFARHTMWSHKENTSRVQIWSCALPVCFSIPQLLPSPSIWLCLQQENAYLFKAPRQLKTNHVLTAKASHSQKPFHDKAGIVIRLHREHHSNGRVESQHSGPAT